MRRASERGDPADPLRLAVGHAIQRARHDAGLSMRGLAQACGLSQPFLSAIERGLSTPSIATLYRLAEVLGTAPADLLPPPPDDDDVHVVRAGEGELVPSSDRPRSAVGRVVFSDARRHLEVYDYAASTDEDLDVWFEHPGDAVLHLVGGRLRVDFEGREPVLLGPGDCLVHPGTVAHRWTVLEDARLFLVVVRPEPVNR